MISNEEIEKGANALEEELQRTMAYGLGLDEAKVVVETILKAMDIRPQLQEDINDREEDDETTMAG